MQLNICVSNTFKKEIMPKSVSKDLKKPIKIFSTYFSRISRNIFQKDFIQTLE